jgi:hypothetical protein
MENFLMRITALGRVAVLLIATSLLASEMQSGNAETLGF